VLQEPIPWRQRAGDPIGALQHSLCASHVPSLGELQSRRGGCRHEGAHVKEERLTVFFSNLFKRFPRGGSVTRS
jgi:hypothetical protein